VAQAARFFTSCIVGMRSDAWSHYFRSVCYLQENKGEPPPDSLQWARENLNVCLRQPQQHAWLYLVRGVVSGRLKDYQGAEDDFNQALRARDPRLTLDERYTLYNTRAAFRRQRGATAAAIEDLRQAIRLCPNRYEAYAGLAKVYHEQGLRNASAMRGVTGLTPAGCSAIVGVWAWAHERQQLALGIAHLDEAERRALLLAEAGHLQPETLAHLYHTRAVYEFERDDRDAAVRDLDRVVAREVPRSPARAQAYVNKGRLLHARRDYEGAVEAYRKALAIRADELTTYVALAEAHYRLGQYAAAVQACDAYVERQGKPEAAVYRLRGLAHAGLGGDHLASAVQDFELALILDRGHRFTWIELGRVNLALRAFAQAESAFTQTITLQPTAADGYIGRGLARARLGHGPQAAADAEKALDCGGHTSAVRYQAAAIYAQVVGALSGRRDSETTLRRTRYQERALELLRRALAVLPEVEARALWARTILPDHTFDPIRDTTEFGRLAVRYSPRHEGARR
jgi:tetratricopeptide (TPR) repeat protein